MKKLIILIALVLISHSVVFSQGCLPEGISFTTQEQIDNFALNYPGCTEIEGDISIKDYGTGNITNLDGLCVLIATGGSLSINENHSLISIIGLANLTAIEGYLWIGSNEALTNLNGLEYVTSIGGNLDITINSALTNLNGLANLSSIGGYLEISDNSALTSLSGLDNLSSIEGDLIILYNTVLTSLNGLENIASGSIENLHIYENSLLTNCDAQSICNYLATPNGIINIFNNSPGCNNPSEVQQACLISGEEIIAKEEITISPNPATSFITINVKEGIPVEEAIIYNHLGQKALEAMPVNNSVDVSTLKPGMYMVEVFTKENQARQKLVIK
jgi:hypothetical protein